MADEFEKMGESLKDSYGDDLVETILKGIAAE